MKNVSLQGRPGGEEDRGEEGRRPDQGPEEAAAQREAEEREAAGEDVDDVLRGSKYM